MKTAVEWLIEEMLKQGYFDANKQLTFTNLDHLQQQAKEMERKQQDDFAIEFTYYLSDWHTKKRVKQLLEIYKNDTKREIRQSNNATRFRQK